MKKRVLKVLIILIIFQMIICLSNINIVSANSLQSKSDRFLGIGRNKMSQLSISITNLTSPISAIMGFAHFAAIAAAGAYLLMGALSILRQNTLNKADAKSTLGLRILLLVLAVAGLELIFKLIFMFVQ